MDAPTNYVNISEKAMNAKKKYKLTDTQTLLYNHICRGDFKLRNEDGQLFYDENNNGFGWSGSRDWVKKQFEPLIKSGIVKFKSLRDCRDGKYTSWYFYDPKFELKELIDASCYVTTHKLAMIKHYLKLPDGFAKQNKKYGDVEFIFNKKDGYTFKYKGEESIYYWDCDGEGKKEDTFDFVLHYDDFDELVHDLWSFMAHDGKKYLNKIPNYTERRRFTI